MYIFYILSMCRQFYFTTRNDNSINWSTEGLQRFGVCVYHQPTVRIHNKTVVQWFGDWWTLHELWILNGNYFYYFNSQSQRPYSFSLFMIKYVVIILLIQRQGRKIYASLFSYFPSSITIAIVPLKILTSLSGKYYSGRTSIQRFKLQCTPIDGWHLWKLSKCIWKVFFGVSALAFRLVRSILNFILKVSPYFRKDEVSENYRTLHYYVFPFIKSHSQIN